MRDAFYPKLRLHPERDARLIRWWHSLPPSERASEWRRVLHWALDLIENGWVPGVVVPFEAVRSITNPVAPHAPSTTEPQPPPVERASREDAESEAAPDDAPDGAAATTSADPRWGGLLAEFE